MSEQLDRIEAMLADVLDRMDRANMADRATHESRVEAERIYWERRFARHEEHPGPVEGCFLCSLECRMGDRRGTA